MHYWQPYNILVCGNEYFLFSPEVFNFYSLSSFGFQKKKFLSFVSICG